MAPIISPAGAVPGPKTGPNTGGATTSTTVSNGQPTLVPVSNSLTASCPSGI